MSKLSNYYAELDRQAPGWDKDRHQAALRNVSDCRGQLNPNAGGAERMGQFITCMRGKKLPVKTA
jgi:hypothetical protein